MKIDPVIIESLKEKFAHYREFLKNWLEPLNLARLRPKLEFQTGILAGFALLASVLARRDQLQYGRHDSAAAQ